MKIYRTGFLRIGLLVLLGASIVGGVVLYWTSQPTDLEHRTLIELNKARAQAGTPPIAADWRLTLASRRQADYMAETGRIEHIRETNRGLLWLQEMPEGRHLSAFYFSRGGEALTGSYSNDPAETLSDLLDAPYHRLILLDASARHAGVGLVFTKSVFPHWYAAFTVGAVGDSAPLALTVWPTPDSKDVPRYIIPSTEEPNIAPEAKVVGYVPSVQVGSDRTLTTKQFVLRNLMTGDAVSGRIVTERFDKHMPESGVAFIPQFVLEGSTTYQVEYKGSTASGAISKSWRFTTQPTPAYAITLESRNSGKSPVYLAMSSPVQPVNVCYKSSAGTKAVLTQLDEKRAVFDVQECGAAKCYVRIFLSDAPHCSSQKAKIGLIFGGAYPPSVPTLLPHS
jgi:hypothetical protein